MSAESTGVSSTPQRSPSCSTLTEVSHQTDPSERRYELSDFMPIGGTIGTGSFGAVQKVAHRGSADIFAMKVIQKSKIEEHRMTPYLFREVRTQLRLRHPHILRLFYYFEDGDAVHLLLEYASEGSLFSLMRKRRRLTESEAAPIFAGVTSALDHLHAHGIIHRDVKPENILMCSGGVPKLADFGWCAEVADGGPRNTFCGTWDYLAPEMVSSESHGFSVDLWALGVLLHEVLLGSVPFVGKTQAETLAKISTADFRLPEALAPLAGDLIRRLLVRERHKRLPLADVLQHAWLQEHGVAQKGVSGALAAAQAATPSEEKGQALPRQAPCSASEAERPLSPVTAPPPRGCAAAAPWPRLPAEQQCQASLEGASQQGLADKGDAWRDKEPRLGERKEAARAHAGARGRLNCVDLEDDDSGDRDGRRLPPGSHGSLSEVDLSGLEPASSSLGSRLGSDNGRRPSFRDVRDISPVVVRGVTPMMTRSTNESTSGNGLTPASCASDALTTTWAETKTFEAVRCWVRRDAPRKKSLHTDLDRTLSSTVVDALREGAAKLSAGSRDVGQACQGGRVQEDEISPISTPMGTVREVHASAQSAERQGPIDEADVWPQRDDMGRLASRTRLREMGNDPEQAAEDCKLIGNSCRQLAKQGSTPGNGTSDSGPGERPGLRCHVPDSELLAHVSDLYVEQQDLVCMPQSRSPAQPDTSLRWIAGADCLQRAR